MDSHQLLFDADAHSSGSHDDTESTDDTFEMTGMEEVPVTPRRGPDYGTTRYAEEVHDSDGDSDVEDALLGSRAHARTRGRERSEERPSAYAQGKRIVLETAPTLFLTTIGLLFTGEILDSVSHWKAMTKVDELIMIIPVILNLKGNLEMNLSARLGTAANMGDLDIPAKRRSIIIGNLTLLQVQATVVSFFAAIVAFSMSRLLPNEASFTEDEVSLGELAVRLIARGVHKPTPHRPAPSATPSGAAEFIMVASSAMCAACLSSVLLGSFMCGLVVVCRRFGLDPDNIAPAVASCLGDLVTLSLLGVIAEAHLGVLNTPIVPLLIVIALFLAAVGWTVVTHRNENVRHLLTQGWSPLFIAMAISTGTGIVLDTFVERYSGFALLAVVIAGLPGGVSAIFVSRLSTALHAASSKVADAMDSVAELRGGDSKQHYPSPRLAMITLVIVSIPVEIFFLICVVSFGWITFPFLFIALQVLFFFVAITISLGVAQIITTVLWKRGLDPDMYALPIQSALSDLTGQLLLVACYELGSLMGVKVALKHKHQPKPTT